MQKLGAISDIKSHAKLHRRLKQTHVDLSAHARFAFFMHPLSCCHIQHACTCVMSCYTAIPDTSLKPLALLS